MSQTHEERDHSATTSPPGAPRWVKVFGIIFIILVLVVVMLHLTGNSLGGLHGSVAPTEGRLYQQ